MGTGLLGGDCGREERAWREEVESPKHGPLSAAGLAFSFPPSSLLFVKATFHSIITILKMTSNMILGTNFGG